MADGCEAEMQEEKSTQVGIQTGLKDAFKVVSLASRERLQSLTFKMGSSEAEVLVHAMCLIHLKKRQEALCKLESLPGNSIAKYLADRVKTCHESLVDFKTDSLHSPESQEDALIELARIFRVLAKERLCSESQRDEAYRLALWVSKSNVAGKEEWGSHRAKELMKEAKEACGPCVVTTGSAEVSYPGGRTLTSSSEHCSVFLSGKRDLDRRSTAIPIQNSQCGSSEKGAERSSPSSLRTSSPNGMSFPSHLEVSVSPTTEFDPQRINRDMQDLKLISSQVPSDISTYPIVPGSKTVLPSLKAEEYARESVSTVSAPGSRLPIRHLSPQPPATPFVPGTENYETSSSLASKNSDPKTQLSMGSSLNQTSKTSAPAFSSDFKMKAETQTNEKRFSDISVAVPHENKCEVDKDQEDDEDEEEPVFFSFVIFHAPEDEDTAMELQEKLEGIGIGEGATFSQDFEIPGKSKITCVEDAIDNSAFTILLLSRNFKNQLLEFQTNSALMNSIEKRHKYNSVIPLLPTAADTEDARVADSKGSAVFCNCSVSDTCSTLRDWVSSSPHSRNATTTIL
ncbi:TIR domain-containing adapter molecule 1-like [Arapaima gigas]